jgi:bifunctional non-homologous end joining protein LigD
MKALRGSSKALRFSEHLEGDGPEIYRHACALELEGIVSKRRDFGYRSGRTAAWLKIRNPDYERGGRS